jgi:hypothetical protein
MMSGGNSTVRQKWVLSLLTCMARKTGTVGSVKAGAAASRLRSGRAPKTHSKEQHMMNADEQTPTELRRESMTPTPD